MRDGDRKKDTIGYNYVNNFNTLYQVQTLFSVG
jgi:hypothetical protein